MSISAKRSDLKWGYIAQALNVGAGLLLLPALVRYLPTEDVGLWFVFITLSSLAQLLEFGFQPTVARNTAYVYAGAQTLSSVGAPTAITQDKRLCIELLAELISASRLIYRCVSILAAIALLVGGSAYIATLITPTQDRAQVLLAWSLYASGNIANFYFSYANAILQGRGDVTLANKVVIASRASLLIIGITVLANGLGLIGLGGAMLASCIIGRIVAMWFLHKEASTVAALTLSTTVRGWIMATTLWHNASRLGLVQLSAFLIQRANILLASSFLGLATAASYGMTVTILMALSSVSMVILQVRLPHLVRAQAAKDQSALRDLYGEILVFSWATYLAGLVALVVTGNILLSSIAGKTALLPAPSLIFLGIILALELNHSIAATFLTTRNIIPFLWPSLLSGGAIFLLSISVVNTFQVWGLIAAQGLVQLAYNNWKWPRLVRKELKIGWGELVKIGYRQAINSAKKHSA